MKVADFEREVAAGRLPCPVIFGGEDRWSRTKLDEALERLVGDAPRSDWRAAQPLWNR